ncbi:MULTISPECIES: AzlD domain-containing protein [unclassified Vibrio]|uniref:AzlD domain-containing protein n=1 Tax=Vibrio sp. HB236076 TaxID=3232307 RepID=A0AB39HIF0_9VIBR|nr:AzlD domain-containing protein [Vibrio sp. HB161653]MDP5252789.1 AzlD domain-containing protein [Vibrio sp. HB161653]
MMSTEVTMAIAMICLGTFLLRCLPMVWMRRRLKANSSKANQATPLWLQVLGPTMIAAMCGVSLVPAHPSTLLAFAAIVGCVATVLTWWFSRSLALPVLVGVVCYAVVVLLGG